jgi:guanylate kinase
MAAGMGIGIGVEVSLCLGLLSAGVHYVCTYRNIERVILVGPACSGKDYLRNKLHAMGLTIDVSVTTRPPRDDERPGYTYEYISLEEFIQKKATGELYESVEFGSKCYGTTMQSWIKSDVFIMSPDGVTENIRPEDRHECYIIYLDPPEDVLAQRWASRDDTPEEQRARMATDAAAFKNFFDYDYRISDPNYNAELLCREIKDMLQPTEPVHMSL